MNESAEGVGVYSVESGEDCYPNATGWQIDAEFSLIVRSGPKIVAFYRERSWETVRSLEFDRTAD